MRLKAARDLIEYTGASLKKMSSIGSKVKSVKRIGICVTESLLKKKKQLDMIQSDSWTARTPPIAGIQPAEAHTLC